MNLMHAHLSLNPELIWFSILEFKKKKNTQKYPMGD